MRFSNIQNMKTDIHLFINNMFLFKKLPNIDYSKIIVSLSSGMSCKSLDQKF